MFVFIVRRIFFDHQPGSTASILGPRGSSHTPVLYEIVDRAQGSQPLSRHCSAKLCVADLCACWYCVGVIEEGTPTDFALLGMFSGQAWPPLCSLQMTMRATSVRLQTF